MVDDRQLMRLVDGELSLEEQQVTLRWLDAHPDRWRDCALAFLEEQALRQELAAAQDRAAAASRPNSETSGRQVSEEGIRPDAVDATSRPDGSRRRDAAGSELGWIKMLSLAALVMAAFAVGWLIDMAQAADSGSLDDRVSGPVGSRGSHAG